MRRLTLFAAVLILGCERPPIGIVDPQERFDAVIDIFFGGLVGEPVPFNVDSSLGMSGMCRAGQFYARAADGSISVNVDDRTLRPDSPSRLDLEDPVADARRRLRRIFPSPQMRVTRERGRSMDRISAKFTVNGYAFVNRGCGVILEFDPQTGAIGRYLDLIEIPKVGSGRKDLSLDQARRLAAAAVGIKTTEFQKEDLGWVVREGRFAELCYAFTFFRVSIGPLRHESSWRVYVRASGDGSPFMDDLMLKG